MMNETYENIRPDKGFRFIAEKVSHNPVIIAVRYQLSSFEKWILINDDFQAHAESSNYKYWQCVKVRSKFWGKSMVSKEDEIIFVQCLTQNVMDRN